MKPQPIKRKIRIFLHCLLRLHKRGVFRWRTEDDPTLHYNWVCATCADKQYARMEAEATPEDIEWAKKLVRQHPEWNAE